MRKGIIYSLIGVTAIVLVGFFILSFYVDSRAKSEIETVGTELSQTLVTVEDVAVSLLSGNSTIQNMKIKNAEGFDGGEAITIPDLDISFKLGSMLSDTIRVEEIIIREPTISMIQKVPDNNLNTLMNNMEEAIAADTTESSIVIIDYLLVENGQLVVTPSIGGDPSATIQMDDIELRGVGKEGANTTRVVVGQVATEIIKEAYEAAASLQLEGLKDKAKDAVEDIFN